jgi:hypothetical protein
MPSGFGSTTHSVCPHSVPHPSIVVTLSRIDQSAPPSWQSLSLSKQAAERSCSHDGARVIVEGCFAGDDRSTSGLISHVDASVLCRSFHNCCYWIALLKSVSCDDCQLIDMGKMEAVVFNGPWKIDIERRPKPTFAEPTDAIVKVTTAGICGSELHMYRGHQKSGTGHIMVSSGRRCAPFLSMAQRDLMPEPEP